MIAYIKGNVFSHIENILIVTTNNIGYKILVKPTFASPLNAEEAIELYVYTHMKESSFELFGFSTPQELSLFETLISVSGIGPKTGLAVLSVGSPQDIIKALENKDAGFFTSVPGIGKRTANRVVLELQDKITDEDLMMMTDSHKQDALDALIELGYKRSEAEAALATVEAETPEEQIKEALKAI